MIFSNKFGFILETVSSFTAVKSFIIKVPKLGQMEAFEFPAKPHHRPEAIPLTNVTKLYRNKLVRLSEQNFFHLIQTLRMWTMLSSLSAALNGGGSGVNRTLDGSTYPG